MRINGDCVMSTLGITASQTTTALITASSLVGALGMALGASSYSTAPAIAAIAMSFFGAYGLLASMACFYQYQNDPKQMFQNMGRYMKFAVAASIATIFFGFGKNLLDWHSIILIQK